MTANAGMTIDELAESWINGNRLHVVESIVAKGSPEEIAYYAAAIAVKVEQHETGDIHTLLSLIASKILQ